MAQMMHYDQSTKISSCMRCGRTTWGLPVSECPDCKTVELVQEQNRMIEEEHIRRAKERQRDEDRQWEQDRLARKAARGESDAPNGFMIALARLFIVFMLVAWLLPKKIEGISMVLAIALILAIDKFKPELSTFTVLSAKECAVHWLLLACAIGSAIFG